MMVVSTFSFSLFMFSMMVTSAMEIVDENVPDPTFTDVEYGSAYYYATNYLYDYGVVNGYEDGSFKPNQNINRAEFLRIVMDAASIEVDGSNCYSDVKDEWFAPYVCKATELGHVVGDAGTNNFRPADPVNFAEASKIVVNVMGVTPQQVSEDLPWYASFVMTLENYGAIPATVDAFDHQVTRGEMAEMAYRIADNRTDEVSNTYENIENGVKAFDPKFASAGGELETFASCQDFTAYLDYAFEDNYYWEYDEDSADDGSVAEETSAVSTKSADYSDTNVQVEGVDEADIVKTDGEYIYVLKDGTVRIVKAYTPDEMEEVAVVDFSGDVQSWYGAESMYVDDDKLVVVSSGYGDIAYGLSYEDSYGNSSLTSVYVYDISDKSEPELERKVAFEGSHLSSRKVDDTVYLVTNKYVWSYYDDDPIVPLQRDSADGDEVVESATCTSVYYDPQSRGTDLTTIAAIPVDDTKAAVDEEVIIGSTSEIYASRDNLYLADSTYDWWWGYDYEEETRLHKFSLDGNDVEHEADGAVPGRILNQFSMDEHEGNFRVATTVGQVWNDTSSNNVYILDEDLDQIGDIENIAPKERIYSTRFMGDRLYMVTFKKVDPFFVIDLEDPTDPEILGELKIPGYSNYLHPLDENHIIGFGKDTVDPTDEEADEFWSTVDFAWFQGMKMAIFDVTDVNDPVELHKEIIGDRGTSSELLWNHKALMIDTDKGVMAFPVTLAELPESVSKDPEIPQSAYGQYTYQGAYVYDISVEDGFDLRGRVSHYNEDQLGDAFEYYYYGDEDVMRALYIGDYLYTISRAYVQAHNLDDLEFVNRVILD